MGNPSQVTTHNLQQSRHIRKKKKEALKSLRKVTLKIEPKVRVSNSSNRTAAALQQFQLFSAAADAGAALLCSQFCSNHPSIRLGYLLLRVYTLLATTDVDPALAWKVKGALLRAKSSLLHRAQRKRQKRRARSFLFSASGYTVYYIRAPQQATNRTKILQSIIWVGTYMLCRQNYLIQTKNQHLRTYEAKKVFFSFLKIAVFCIL